MKAEIKVLKEEVKEWRSVVTGVVNNVAGEKTVERRNQSTMTDDVNIFKSKDFINKDISHSTWQTVFLKGQHRHTLREQSKVNPRESLQCSNRYDSLSQETIEHNGNNGDINERQDINNATSSKLLNKKSNLIENRRPNVVTNQYPENEVDFRKKVVPGNSLYSDVTRSGKKYKNSL